MRKSRILAYLLTACMAVTTPVQALAYEGVAEDITATAEESSAEETLASEGVTEETGGSLSETLAEGGGTSDAETGTEVKTSDESAAAETGTEVKASDETVAAETVAEVKTSDETVAAETETEVSVSNESSAAEAETEETEETQESETEDTADAAAVSDTDEEEVIPDVEGMLAEVGALEAAGESVYTAVVSADGTVDQQDVDSGTTVVYIPKTAKRIADQAFKGDSNHKTNYDIEEIVFQSGSAITAIGSEAFCNNSLKGVTIPPTVKFIGSKAFDGNRDLSTVSVNSLVMNLDSESEEIFRNCSISQVKWADGLTMVPDFLFDGAGFDSGYVADFRGSDITEIGTYAYYNSNLGYVDLTGVEEIDPYAFAKKESNTVDSIATLTLPESLMYLGEGAFAFNSKLTTLDIQSCKIQSNTAGNMFYMCKLQTVTWPANIKTIPGGLFKNAYFDKNIDLVMLLPSSVREIGPDAFSMYEATKYDFDEVVIPADSELRTIGDHAFYGRTSLYDINLDAAVSLKTIGAYAFYNVPLSGELELNGIVSIGDFAFYSTGSYYFNSVILGPYLKTLGKQLFGNDAKKIGTVKIYSSQLPESLDNFSNSFKGHTGKLPVFNMNENCAVYKKFKAADTDYAFNMKGGCNTIEHSITYTLNNGKWGTEKGQTKYYEGFVYTFEEPVLNGVKFKGWKLGTVVGNYSEKAITNGVYVDRTETNWYKNIKLTAVYSSTPCFVDNIVLRGFADSALVPTVHGNNILLSDSIVASVKAAEKKVITAYAYPYDTDGDLMNTKQVELTWKSSDTGVVKVNKTKDFTNTFTLTGETGTARLYVYARGYGGLEIWSNYVTVTVRTMEPTLSYTSIEINKYENIARVPLVENTTEVVSEDRKGNETTIVKVTDSEGNYQEDQDLLLFPYGSGWYVSLTDPSKYEKETIKKKLYLSVVTRYGTTYNDPVPIGPFSLKITVTPPAVTLSSSPTYKGNPFYANEEDAKLVYDIGGTCVVTRVLASAPQNASYPCPWGKDIDGSDYNELELDPTGTSLIMKPYLINGYVWQSKGNWDNFMLWMKQKVVLTIYGMNSDGEEFVFEKTITPSVSAAKAPKYTLDEITVFDRDGENAWYGNRKMVLRNEYGDIIDNDLLNYEFPISPSTSDPKGFIVTTDGYLNFEETETTFKSGSLKIRITSPLWTQPLDVTQKISSTVEEDPNTLILSQNKLKISYETLENLDLLDIGVRYKGSQTVPSSVLFVDSGKATPTPDDEAIKSETYSDGVITISLNSLNDGDVSIKSIIDSNPKWKCAHTFKFKYRVPGQKKTATFTLQVTNKTKVSLSAKGAINILNREISFATVTPKITGTLGDVYVTSATLTHYYTNVNEGITKDEDDVYSDFSAYIRESDHKILVFYDGEQKPGSKKLGFELTLSDGTVKYANVTVKTTQSQSGVKYEKSFKLGRNAAGYGEVAFNILEKKGTRFSRTYEIDRGGAGVEVLSFAPSAKSRKGYSDRIRYDAVNNIFILTDDILNPMKTGTYKLKLAVHYKGEYLNPVTEKPLTTITITVRLKDL